MQIGEISGDESCPPWLRGVLPLAERQLPLPPRTVQVVVEEEQPAEQLMSERIRASAGRGAEVARRGVKVTGRQRSLRRLDQRCTIHRRQGTATPACEGRCGRRDRLAVRGGLGGDAGT